VLGSVVEEASMRGIVGTWKLLSMVSRDEATGEETQLWGEAPIGFLTYTDDGRMSAVVAAARRPISTDSAGAASIEEQAMLFRRSVAYAGRYSLTGDGVTHHVEVAADPTWIGKDQHRFTRFEGERLIITTPSIPTAAAPSSLVFVLVWERVTR
jgi:hypothetical protein